MVSLYVEWCVARWLFSGGGVAKSGIVGIPYVLPRTRSTQPHFLLPYRYMLHIPRSSKSDLIFFLWQTTKLVTLQVRVFGLCASEIQYRCIQGYTYCNPGNSLKIIDNQRYAF